MEKVNYNSEDLKSHDAIAGVIKNEEGKVLMLDHVKFNFFTIPVGKCQPGESVEDGLMTEMGEELGIKPVDYTEIGNFVKTYNRDGIDVTVDAHIFIIKSYDGTITNNEPQKHRDIIWMTHDEMRALPKGKISHSSLAYLEMLDKYNVE